MTAAFPEKLQFLFEAHRYKVLYGGRGGAKSWGIARWLLIEGAQRKLRILCARELQKSIADSVHKLLCDQIVDLGLESHYAIEKARILGTNGTEFIFAGLKHSPSSLKSYEGVDKVWCEEGQAISRDSWNTLIPTIRKEGSEIIVSMNPVLETDDSYKRFVLNPQANAVVCKIGFRDNPWFPDVLRAEMEHSKATDPDGYQHIWEGDCVRQLEGAIYSRELRAAESEVRIARVAYDPTKLVHVAFDLGEGDQSALWFFQIFMAEYRFIDYLEDSGQKMQHYLSIMQGKGYLYSTLFLPWDACSGMMSGSLEQAFRAAGHKIRILPKLSVAAGIDTARTIFPNCWFDADKCEPGLQSLRHYRYQTVTDMGTNARLPVHDWASHGADAFRYAATGIVLPKKEQKTPPRAARRTSYTPGPTAWS